MSEGPAGGRCVAAGDGSLIVRDGDGGELELRPWLEGANAQAFDQEFFEELIASTTDVLAERTLEAGEPCYERIAGILPRAIGETFVGDPRRDERFIIQPDGSVEGLLGPLTGMAPEELARHGRWGLIDRKLPLPMLRVEASGQPAREQIAVADIGPDGEPRLLVRRQTGAKVEYLAPAAECDDPESAFAGAVLAQWRLVSDFHERGMTLSGGDEILNDLAASSLWLADLTLRGCRPRYGIGTYDRFKDHGFPPTIIHHGRCLLEWGHLERAAEVIGCYLDAYVSDEGTFVYYGPALAEYGQVLSLCASYVDLTGDERWWRTHESVLRRIWGRVLALRREALADDDVPPNGRGLIPGLPEADYHHTPQEWRQYYYAGDAWTIRGLKDVARILQRTGAEDEAARLEAEVRAWTRDLQGSIEAASVQTEDGVYVPPGPTQTQPIERMTQDRHASYCNYRYFAEMVSAGVLPQRVMRRVLDWRAAHGGELLAMTRFQDHLDDWPVLNYARALLEIGEIERYLLLLYAHLAHHQAAGWLAAPEQVTMLPDASGVRRYHAGQVVPCQVVAPQMLRWALAYEPRDEEMLLVAPAAPAKWIADGLSVERLPTRWGPVDVAMKRTEAGIEAEVRMPDGVPEVGVRLPLAPGEKLHRADIDGGLMLETADDEVFVQPREAVVRVLAETAGE